MFSFEPQRYGAQCAELITSAGRSPLGPGSPNTAARSSLDALEDESMFPGHTVRDPEMAACCRSGLWLLHNFLDTSHQISQDLPTSAGSYWHAIMHRREPDFSNAKYWFGRVGPFPTFPQLADAARAIANEHSGDASLGLRLEAASGGPWDPAQFVDFCAAAAGDPRLETLACEIAHREWQLLFDYCYHEAISE